MGVEKFTAQNHSPGGGVLAAAAGDKLCRAIFRFRNLRQQIQDFFSIALPYEGRADGNAGVLKNSRLYFPEAGKAHGLAAALFVDKLGRPPCLKGNGAAHSLLGVFGAGCHIPEHVFRGFPAAPQVALHPLPV